ncbi:MAG: hypothetical protein K2O81_00030 [Clostridia bacterium]|nr:hypothetical protein [Clostridia bacterium]
MKKRYNGQFKDALYVSKCSGEPGLVVVFLIFAIFSAVGLIIFNCEKNIPKQTVTVANVILSAILALMLILVMVGIVKNYLIAKKISFAVYEQYLIILENGKQSDYKKINYTDIIGYTFEPHVTYDEDDSAHLFPTVFNFGYLFLTVKNETFKTQISDINTAKEWLSKFACITEII